jgi:hypothetical protein
VEYQYVDLSVFAANKSLAPVDMEVVRKRHGHSKNSTFRQYLEEFVSSFREGDVVYWYDSDQASWEEGMGSEGDILVRDGRIVASLVVKMN